MQKSFEHKSLPELLDVILLGNSESDEAMWYVLHEMMREDLRKKYLDFEYQLWDSYEDLIDDFFLYMREGKQGCKHEPYTVLRTINNKEAFESWLLSTWRNYLSNRVDNEGAQKNGVGEIDEMTLAAINDNKSITDERKIEVVSQLIAYCLQVFLPRGRFIFLRSILTILNKEQALSTKDMAEALGMTEINYRVVNHRMKANEHEFLKRILKGETLRLNEVGKNIAVQIGEDFDNLYPILMRFYMDTLQTLKQRDAIQTLRLSNIQTDGTLLHEANYKTSVGIRAFWSKLIKDICTRKIMTIEEHPLEPFLPSNAKILFLGSFPPPKARWSMDFFYPNWINDFWRIQGLIHLGDRAYFEVAGEKRFDKKRIVAFCNEKGIALFDTARKVCRLKDNADDNFLEIVEGTDVFALLEQMTECKTIVTTGGKASEELQTYFEKKDIKVKMPKVGSFVEIPSTINYKPSTLKWFRMPSSSRAYPMKLEKKAEYYHRLWD